MAKRELFIFTNAGIDSDHKIDMRPVVKVYMQTILGDGEGVSGDCLPESAADEFRLHDYSEDEMGDIPRWVFEVAEEVLLERYRYRTQLPKDLP